MVTTFYRHAENTEFARCSAPQVCLLNAGASSVRGRLLEECLELAQGFARSIPRCVQPSPLLGAGEHGDHLVGRLHIGKKAGHRLEFRFMGLVVDLGHRIFNQDHSIIMLDSAAYGRRHADARGDAGDNAGGHAQSA